MLEWIYRGFLLVVAMAQLEDINIKWVALKSSHEFWTKTFLQRVVRMWNLTPQEMVDVSSIDTFKVKLDK